MKRKSILITSLLACTILLAWCHNKPNVQEQPITTELWDTVTLTYDSYFQDGEIIEQWIEKTIILWFEELFPIFDTELLWMETWEEKTFMTKDPSQWYWIYYNSTKIQEISSSIINTIWLEPKVWEQVNLWWLKWVILEIYPASVKIDFNDKQTRENVEFHVTIKNIQKNVNNIWE